jgi:hypothetical protein
MRRFVNPSMVVASLALAVALSGTAYAVTRLPTNSVGTKQVINHSLQRVDFTRGMLLRGPAGERGPQGPKGVTGPQGVAGTIRTNYRSNSGAISATAGVATTVTTTCPEGWWRLSGGFKAYVPVLVLESYSPTRTDWRVSVQSTGVAGMVYVYSTCINLPVVVS